MKETDKNMILQVGQSACYSKTVTEEDICKYAELTGDTNSIHINEQKAKKSRFGERVAHGFLTAGYISAVIGTKLPGDGTIYLSQNLNFEKPVLIGDTITVYCNVAEVINPQKRIYRIETICKNQFDEVVVSGEAVVKHEPIPEDDIEDEKENRKESFFSERELKSLGIKKFGKNVKISRNAVLYHPDLLEMGNNIRIDDFTTISGKVVLGDYIHIAQFCGLYGGEAGIFMDDFSGLSSRVVIYATSNDYSGESLTNPTVPAKYKCLDKNEPVHIGKHAIIGTTSVILPGVNIGIGCSVGAMSLCSKDLDEWGIYVGCPVKRIKERSKKVLMMEKELREEEAMDDRQ